MKQLLTIIANIFNSLFGYRRLFKKNYEPDSGLFI